MSLCTSLTMFFERIAKHEKHVVVRFKEMSILYIFIILFGGITVYADFIQHNSLFRKGSSDFFVCFIQQFLNKKLFGKSAELNSFSVRELTRFGKNNLTFLFHLILKSPGAYFAGINLVHRAFLLWERSWVVGGWFEVEVSGSPKILAVLYTSFWSRRNSFCFEQEVQWDILQRGEA